MRGLALVERRDEWLDDGNRTIEGARVRPGFEVVRFGNVPVAEFRSLVFVIAEI